MFLTGDNQDTLTCKILIYVLVFSDSPHLASFKHKCELQTSLNRLFVGFFSENIDEHWCMKKTLQKKQTRKKKQRYVLYIFNETRGEKLPPAAPRLYSEKKTRFDIVLLKPCCEINGDYSLHLRIFIFLPSLLCALGGKNPWGGCGINTFNCLFFSLQRLFLNFILRNKTRKTNQKKCWKRKWISLNTPSTRTHTHTHTCSCGRWVSVIIFVLCTLKSLFYIKSGSVN